MSPEAKRGLVLAIAAALTGLLVLGVGFDDAGFDSVAPAPEPTTTPDAVPTPEPTVAVSRPPSQVEVLVANATDTPGLAGNITTQLAGIGYSMLEPTNATVAPSDGLSDIHFAPGFEAEAVVLAAELQLPASQVSALPATAPIDGDLAGVEVLVILAADKAPVG